MREMVATVSPEFIGGVCKEKEGKRRFVIQSSAAKLIEEKEG